MIRKNIIKNKNDKQRYFLNDSWRIEMPAVVRTPFYGNNCSEYFGYVVTYSEMEQAYHLLKVDLHNGKILWSIDAVNGGYGTPTVFGDLVVFLKEFDAVQAVSAESGIVEWAVQGGHRVRTTLNVIDETLWFGSGSTLLAVNKNGEVVKKLHIPNSFIYGNITPYKGGILCTGTLHNNERDCSCSYLWLINQEGSIMYSMELGRSPVISSDTSGIWLKDDFAFASCGHDIICFDLKVGKELWRTRVFGFCGRHFPVVDSQRVYYTTLKGEVGCADILNGSIVWRQKFREGLIVAPPSIYGKTLFVLADCSVFLLDKDTGEIFQHKVVGHTPYSAVSFGTNKALIGAGEPPANGQLICFDVVSEAHVSLPMYNDVYFLEEKDCNLMSVLIETGGELTLGNKKIFDNASLYVNKGEHIIIRGENGSGKSTLLKVIAKILDIDSGQITYGLPSIDGIMYVSQNTNLFNRSIYENIIYPMDDANLEEVYELINIFGLNSLITSENDLFQKKPGDFGNKFSGGEKQKILIIRTLINRPHIILFDEITSSLDSNSTKVFYEMLNTRLSSSTVLFVSHDDVVDSAFDRVLEIDELHAL